MTLWGSFLSCAHVHKSGYPWRLGGEIVACPEGWGAWVLKPTYKFPKMCKINSFWHWLFGMISVTQLPVTLKVCCRKWSGHAGAEIIFQKEVCFIWFTKRKEGKKKKAGRFSVLLHSLVTEHILWKNISLVDNMLALRCSWFPVRNLSRDKVLLRCVWMSTKIRIGQMKHENNLSFRGARS